MRFDPFAEPLRQELLRALKPQLHELTIRSDRPEAEEAFSLHESCRVWILDLPSEIPNDQPLESFRRGGQMWHHQIWSQGEPAYYTRSVIPDPPVPAPPIRLIKVTRSPRAAQFDSTLSWLDRPENAALFNEPPGADWWVRLLITARFDIHAFALVDEEENIRKVVEFPSAYGGGTFRVIDQVSLREEIVRRQVCFGLQVEERPPAPPPGPG